MHLGYFHDKQTGDLMSRIVNDTRDFELLYAHMIPETITNLVTFTGVLAVLLTVNWKLALITCAPIPLIFLSGIVFSKKVRPYFRISQKKMGELNGKLQDNLSGIHEIQSFGREEYETERVNERNFEHIRAMLQALKITSFFYVFLGIIYVSRGVLNGVSSPATAGFTAEPQQRFDHTLPPSEVVWYPPFFSRKHSAGCRRARPAAR